MINFPIDTCPKCGRKAVVMISNNPLSGKTICFDCIANNLNYKNLEHAEFFCRSYNLPWNPELWIQLSEEHKQGVFRQYTQLVLEDKTNQPNLVYETSTHDLWSRTNKEWEKCRSFKEILSRIEPMKESYIMRGRLKWGEQYTFEELIKLDSVYTRTLKANNIINPLQREAVKSLCKIHIEMDEAIRAKDAKALKDYSSSYSTFAKQADLEGMINETKTDDITTVAELYDFMEKNGFKFQFNDGFDRDEVDRTIKDMQEYLRKLVLESTGLQPLLEDMMRQKMQTAEEEKTAELTQQTTLQDLLNFTPEDTSIDTESDDDVLSEEFEDDTKAQTTVVHFKEDKECQD